MEKPVCYTVLAFISCILLTTLSLHSASGGFKASTIPLFWNGHSTSTVLFCQDKPTPFPQSFWFVKVPKVGGSTLGGVMRSVAAHHGIYTITPSPGQFFFSDPWVEAALANLTTLSAREHKYVAVANHIGYNPNLEQFFPSNPILKFTGVREPVSRVYSYFIEKLCRIQMNNGEFCEKDTLANRRTFASRLKEDSIFNYVKGNATTAQEAFDQYNFMFVQERMFESLVVFMLDFGLDYWDIAHISTKIRTGMYKQADEMPEELNQYIESRNSKDAELWKLANEDLDRRIARIGKRCGSSYFDEALDLFNSIQDAVYDECTNYEDWYKAHDFNTSLTYWFDNGKGPRCTEYVARRISQTFGR